MIKLSDIKRRFNDYLVIVDPYAIDIILATVAGNLIVPRDPLWTMLVAQSSGGKSTLMAPCAAIPNIYFIDDLTDKTFLSGYKIGKQEVSLLKIMGNGVMCFSDFTSILAKDITSRGEILSQFRLVYDGTFIKRTGTGEIRWSGKMGFLGAATPDVYFQLESARSMGERYLYYAITQPTDQAIVEKQEAVKMSSKQITEEMKPLYRDYFTGLRDFIAENGIPDLSMTPEQVSRVHRASIFCVLGKASIHLDFKTGRPDTIPNKPGVGRDRKMFNTLLHALQVMHAYEMGDPKATVQDDHIKIVEKCAYSSINRERRKCLEILSIADTPLSSTVLGATDNFGLGKEAIEKIVFPLFAVNIINRTKNGSGFRWEIRDPDIKSFVRTVADSIPDKVAEEELVEIKDQFEGW